MSIHGAGQDLGELFGPVVVMGGICGNLPALEAFLARFDACHPGASLVCTGDLVAYFADPGPCVDLVRSRHIPVIAGNCELALASGSRDCGCGFSPGSTCDLLKDRWYRYCAENLSDEQLAWMGELPTTLRFDFAGRSVMVAHGAPSQVNRYVFATSGDDVFRDEFALAGTDIIIAGHSGLPFTRRTDRPSGAVAGAGDGLAGIWHNSGSLGMPANDGTPRVWYSVLDSRDGNVRFTHHGLEYPFTQAAARVTGSGLAQEYALSLTHGLWPCDDIMPEAGRRERGLPIEPDALGAA